MSITSFVTRVVGPRAAVAVRRIGAVPPGALHDAEARTVARASQVRRLEMAAGRSAARAALAAFGIMDVTIPRGERGIPLFPQGFVGSITHTREVAVAVVASRESFAGMGIDAEPNDGLEGDLFSSIATQRELQALTELEPAAARLRAHMLFCAKEALFKCQYPVTKLMLDFKDVEVSWLEPSRGELGAPSASELHFAVTWRGPAPPLARRAEIHGTVGHAEGHLVAVAVLGPEYRD